MLKSLTFWTLVLSLNTAWATLKCGSFLNEAQSPVFTSQFQPHTLRRIDPQPWDIAEHGHLIEYRGLTGLDKVKNIISKRDGTYPLIIDEHQNMVIDHRLPESSFADLNAEAFVGNHLGLYNRLQNLNGGSAPKIFFAGQIRVVGGKVKNLIDQSGSFYFKPEDLGFTGEDKITNLVAHNQHRLDSAFQLLSSFQIVDESTEVKNFVHLFANYSNSLDRNEGHVKAKDAARFERFCRNNSSCWSKHQKIERALRELVKIGSKSEIIAYLMKDFKTDPVRIGDSIQIWTMLLSEGVTELLSISGALDTETSQGALIDKFIKGLDQMEFL